MVGVNRSFSIEGPMRWKQLLKPPPGDLWLDAVLWAALSLYILFQVGMKREPLFSHGMPNAVLWILLLSLLAAIGYWLAQKWVRPLVFVLLVAVSLYFLAIAALHTGLTLWSVTVIGLCVWGAWRTWHEEIPSRDADADGEANDQPMLSLALLLREPMFLDATIIARIASQAWDADIRPSSDDSSVSEDGDGLVIGSDEISLYMLACGDRGMFMVHNRNVPYFEDVEAVAADCPELRARAAILEHTAWVAMDLMHVGNEDPTAKPHAYRLIGRFLAELADESLCLAVIEPQQGMLYPYDPETERKLLSDDPVNALREQFYSPILQAREEDLAAAVAEARRRWPEFVTAFENRTDGGPGFLIKAPFGSGENVEFMWVEVTALEGDIILGTLMNHPHAIPQLHEGDRVRVDVADLNDWLCVVDRQAVGAFTQAALDAGSRQPDKPS